MSSPENPDVAACARCGAPLGPEGHCQACAPASPPAEESAPRPSPLERLLAVRDRLLQPRSLLTALLCVDVAFIGVRLLQLAFPLLVPRVLEAWLLWPLLWDVPLNARPEVARFALVPWVLWGVIHLLQFEVLRASGGLPALARRQVLALALVPGYVLAGFPRLFGALAEALPRRATALKVAAFGLPVAHLSVAATLAWAVWTDAPEGRLGGLAADGVLLFLQLFALRTVFQALREQVVAPPVLDLLPDDVAPGGVPEALPARQDAGFDCPECPPMTPQLYREAERLGAHCGRCEGDLLLPRERAQVLSEVGVTEAALGQLMMETVGRQVHCASCGGTAVTVVLRGAAISPCAACGTLWTRAGMLHQLSQGRHGRPRARPVIATKPKARGVLSPVASVGALVGLVFGGTGLGLLLSELSPCPAGCRVERQPREGGSVLHRCLAANDLPEGPSFLRDARGRLRERQEWAKGERTGAWRQWDERGRLRREGEYYRQQAGGVWRSYDEAGALRLQVPITSNRVHGEVVEFWADGTPWERRSYAAGVLQGPYVLSFANGRKRVEGTFEKGRRSGDWTIYDETGKRVDSAWWSQGRRSLVVVDGEAEQAEQVGAPSVDEVKPSVPRDALYAGHPMEWWAHRLRLLWPQRAQPEGAARYALTVRRAGLLGLKVDETTAGPRVRLASEVTEAQAREETP